MSGGRSKRGLVGMSALIILIAIILISAATAALILNHVHKVSSRSVSTKNEVERHVINGIEIVQVEGEDGSVGRDIEHFEMVVRLQAGSDTIGLINNTLLVFETPETFQSLSYNSTQGNTANNAAGTSDYTVEWVKTASDYETGYLKRGDLIKIRWNYHANGPTDTEGGVPEDTLVKIKIVPQLGSHTVVQFRTPGHITEKRVALYPKGLRI